MEKNPLQKEKEKALTEMLEDDSVNPETPVEKKKPSRKKSAAKRKSKAELEMEKREALKTEVEGLADILIQSANSWCEEKGLSPMNPLQAMLIRTGLIGTAMKYNISLDEYPEFALLTGAGWFAYEKYIELRKKVSEQEKERNNEKAGI